MVCAMIIEYIFTTRALLLATAGHANSNLATLLSRYTPMLRNKIGQKTKVFDNKGGKT